MKKYLFLFLLLALTLPMSSCRRAAEKARKNIRIEALEKFERHGMTAADVVVRVMNNTGYKLVLDKASIDVFFNGSRVGTITLSEGVEVMRRTTQSVATRWQIRLSDPLALYVMIKKIEAGDLSQISLSYAAEGRGGPAPVKISREMVPVSEILNTFGLTLQDLGKYLKE